MTARNCPRRVTAADGDDEGCVWPEIDTEPPFPIIPQTLAMRLASFSMLEEKILPWLLKTF